MRRSVGGDKEERDTEQNRNMTISFITLLNVEYFVKMRGGF